MYVKGLPGWFASREVPINKYGNPRDGTWVLDIPSVTVYIHQTPLDGYLVVTEFRLLITPVLSSGLCRTFSTTDPSQDSPLWLVLFPVLPTKSGPRPPPSSNL